MNKNELRLAGVIRESIVDGPGWRFVVFSQGCPHYCDGCQNPHTHDFSGGYVSDVDNLIEEIKKNPLLSGVTLSGGEPFSQAFKLAEFAKKVHLLNLNVMTYSGWTYEEILEKANEENSWKELLEQTDILIDGKYIKEQKSLSLAFRGSKNQRAIDVKKSLNENKVVLIDL